MAVSAKATRLLDRRPQILDAAERCFALHGFHKTTMQDVAREASMVPGNLYRYFPSKHAIIAGIVERDRAEIAADFASLASAANLMDAFKALGRKHFIDQPREKAVIALQIWSEAALDPEIATLVATIHAEVRRGILDVLTKARAAGQVHPDVDLDAVAKLVLTLSDGMIRRRAIDRDFQSQGEVENALCVIGAVLGGAIPLSHP
jgi:TetR/AcrR family transcriptional regulator, repressor for uid operon